MGWFKDFQRGFRKVRNDVSREVRKLSFSDVLDVIPTLARAEAEQLLGKVQARIADLGGFPALGSIAPVERQGDGNETD